MSSSNRSEKPKTCVKELPLYSPTKIHYYVLVVIEDKHSVWPFSCCNKITYLNHDREQCSTSHSRCYTQTLRAANYSIRPAPVRSTYWHCLCTITDALQVVDWCAANNQADNNDARIPNPDSPHPIRPEQRDPSVWKIPIYTYTQTEHILVCCSAMRPGFSIYLIIYTIFIPLSCTSVCKSTSSSVVAPLHNKIIYADPPAQLLAAYHWHTFNAVLSCSSAYHVYVHVTLSIIGHALSLVLRPVH